jgi:formylmethanofuran dehydrogenase subunit E
MKRPAFHVLVALALLIPVAASAETRDEWISLGTRIHGAFSSFIPVGIRIGLDAMDKLKPVRRGLTITYYNGTKPPCPCVADGLMLATHTSPGQGTFQISPEKAPDGMMAVIVATNKNSGEALRYSISDAWLPKILLWLNGDPEARYDAAMSAEGLFQVKAAK